MSHYICNQCDGSSGDEKNYNGELINEKMNSRMNQNNIPNNDTNNDLKQNESSTKHKKPFKRQLTSSSYIGDNYPNDEDNDYFITVGKNSKRKQRTKDGNNEFDNNDENTLIIDHVNSSTTAPNVNTGRTFLFADDLALVFIGSLEKKFSQNIIDLEIKAKEAMMILEKFADNLILPVNVNKTKSLLIHNIVSPTKPRNNNNM